VRILVTGSRDHEDRDLIWTCIGQFAYPHLKADTTVTIVHGSATGADTLARDWAREHGAEHEPHPYMRQMGKRGGPIRNQLMVDIGADICLAFPLGLSRGTFDCARRANKAGIPTYWCRRLEDGSVSIVEFGKEPYTPPRYDDVYHQGTAWLDALARGEAEDDL
jgi:hypothetical protein